MATKTINLALQGGGSHGAFTWGVLDRLLEDKRIELSAISGTSAGAMNAAALAQGWMSGGRDGARESLDRFWKRVSDAALFVPVRGTPWNDWWAAWTGHGSPGRELLRQVSRAVSPYQFNPAGLNPLRDIVAESFDFEKIGACEALTLFIAATNVFTGKVRVFSGAEVTADVLAASACLPQLFQAVEIDGEPYWDGGYMGNPALFPLFYHPGPEDILLVQVSPIERRQLPTSVEDIDNRIDEIAFNGSLLRELRAIEFVDRLIETRQIVAGKRYRKILMHRVDGGDELAAHSPATKMNADWPFLTALRDLGRAKADQWLKANYAAIGRKATLDLRGIYT
ncbi:patatin-like phospholipase family protein [Sphingosinicella microcystinivorans]|uniref:patatin-like phospholipase family protein n=1 Tax=Sphingosinicella microcystinivorans TaxID=335406 RepID=UPI0022F3C950|nr:patatin-like phospholipase family protein [Sphingosinicella microcystinivorans]WBX83667.1 patatin-like phospholipase family protein [Sphingosinicella microcystinivorans]